MRMPEPRLQHQAAPEEEEGLLQIKGLLQREIERGMEAPSETPAIIHEVLHTPGRPLDPATRAFMEPRFGHDFSQVRVHTDAQAAASARAVNALAYTVGRNVVFGAGQYSAETSTGKRLIAHELAHVIQQGEVMPYSTVSMQRQAIDKEGEEMIEATEEVEGMPEAEEEPESGPSTEESSPDEESPGEVTPDTAPITLLTFDGRQVTALGGGSPFTAPAISGLMQHHPRAGGIDYTQPRYQDVADKGPIPEGDYYINPSEAETAQDAGFSPSAWGHYRTRLHERFFTRLKREVLTSRTGGFYLHEDANQNGTAGCIGLMTHQDNAYIHSRIMATSEAFPVKVDYS
jgi:hypothetical protein